MSIEAYKIAVRVSLVENVTRGLVSLSRHFNAVDLDAKKLEQRLASIGKLTLLGGGMAAAGGAALKMLQGPLDAAKAYETAQARFETLNLGATVNRQADEFARGTKVFGTSSTELMETLRESYGMIGNMDMAKRIAPMISELNAANSVMFGGKVGKIDSNATRSIMRFMDMRGLTDTPEEIQRGLNLAQRLVTGSGGALKFNDLEQFAKRGGTAFKALSDEGVMMMSTMMQEMGGASAGNAVMSLQQNLVAGRTTKKAMAALQALGLGELGEVKHGSVGGKDYKTVQIKSIQDRQKLIENPGQWIIDNVIPALDKRGITDTSARAAIINDLISNRTASNLAVSFGTQSAQALRDKLMVQNAMGAQQTVDTAKQKLAGKELDYEAKLANLKLELGQKILPLAVWGLEKLIGALDRVTAFAKEWPNFTQALVVGVAALSGMAVLGGSVLLFKAALGALGIAIPALTASTTVSAAGMALLTTALKVGLAGAAAFAVFEIFKLGDALKQLWDAKHHEGVKLTQTAQDRINAMSPEERARFNALDADFKGRSPLPAGGMRATGSQGQKQRPRSHQHLRQVEACPDRGHTRRRGNRGLEQQAAHRAGHRRRHGHRR